MVFMDIGLITAAVGIAATVGEALDLDNVVPVLYGDGTACGIIDDDPVDDPECS